MSSLWPFFVIGLFSGSVYALASMGIVLTYRTSGVFNFAYGAVAMFCAFTYWQFRDGWHLPEWISLLLVLLVVAPVVGFVSDRLYRPLVGVSTEVQIVVSLGVLAFFEAGVPLAFGGRTRAIQSIFPISTFGVGSILRVSWAQLATFLLTAILALGLYVLLRHTRFGMASRAVIDNRDLAGLLGVNATAVGRTSWVISSVFAGLVGILLSPSQGLQVYVLVTVVIYAFAPAVLGRLVSLPLAYAGGMGLGVLQSVLQRWGASGTVADIEAAFPYLALFVLLVVYGKRLTEVRSGVKPVIGASVMSPLLMSRQKLLTSGGLVALGLFALPVLLRGPDLGDVTAGLIYAAIALTLVVLVGWAGQISLAQFSFVGIGAFMAGHFAGAHGSNFLWAALLAAAIAVPVGLLVGLPSLRLSGLYLALATMAFALLMDNLVFPRTDVSGGYTGMSVPRPRIFGISFASTTSFYELCVVLLVLFGVAALAVQRSAVGRRLKMMRDSPLAASTFGVNLTTTKLVVFALAGAAAAFAGAFDGAWHLTVSPSNYTFAQSLELLLLVVLGGRSLVAGALLAGFTYTTQLLPIPTEIEKFIPITIALGVVSVAAVPEGSVALTVKQFWAALDNFRRLPGSPMPAALALDARGANGAQLERGANGAQLERGANGAQLQRGANGAQLQHGAQQHQGANSAGSDGRDGAAVYPAAALSGRGGESPLGGVAGGVAGSVAGDGSPVEELVATTRGGGGGGDA